MSTTFDESIILAALFDISGAAAGQIKFPATQNPSSNGNTLDDYEEGSWTPVIGGDGGQSGQTYSYQNGRYVKIGLLVIAFGRATLSVKGTITGNVQISGLPFTTENQGNISIAQVAFASLANNFVNVIARLEPNATAFRIWGNTAAAATNLTGLTSADITNTTDIGLTAIYRATA